jgi:hypothetical protein
LVVIFIVGVTRNVFNMVNVPLDVFSGVNYREDLERMTFAALRAAVVMRSMSSFAARTSTA